MNLDETMQNLERLGTEQNRKVYSRHGVTEPQFGVSFANLDKLRKQIKKDQPLAEQLWATGNHDARILATKIADPGQTKAETLSAWVQDVDNYVVTDAFVDLAAKTSQARTMAESWRKDDSEYVARAGWHILAQLAMNDASLPDGYFEPCLVEITESIHDRPNRTREAMHNALMAIGARSDDLLAQAKAVAEQIGAVEIDHGETNCKTPDTIPYMQKARAHRKKKES